MRQWHALVIFERDAKGFESYTMLHYILLEYYVSGHLFFRLLFHAALAAQLSTKAVMVPFYTVVRSSDLQSWTWILDEAYHGLAWNYAHFHIGLGYMATETTQMENRFNWRARRKATTSTTLSSAQHQVQPIFFRSTFVWLKCTGQLVFQWYRSLFSAESWWRGNGTMPIPWYWPLGFATVFTVSISWPH